MLFRRTNPVSHRLARLAFYLACAAALVIAAAAPLYRYLGLDFAVALILLRYGFYLAAAAVALALATIVPTRPGDRRRGFLAAILALIVGIAAAWLPASWFLRARQVPAITDITTDTSNPPAMVVTLAMRQGALTPAGYPGERTAEQQHAAYPDIKPMTLALPPEEAFKKVDQVAMAMGWEVVARAPGDGRIEAIDQDAWFGLKDDIVVRIRADGDGSRVDIRSKSRAGSTDLGANAQRIRTFSQRLKSTE
jgi:uncharacterized protein (DUF1499 family)